MLERNNSVPLSSFVQAERLARVERGFVIKAFERGAVSASVTVLGRPRRHWHCSSNRCNAPIRELSQVQRTCHELVGRVDPTLVTHLYGPAVRCKRVSSIWRTCGLASMYPASDWSVLCSEPSWISARVRSYYRTGLEWAIWVTSVRMRR
jgi:hypothetical protein